MCNIILSYQNVIIKMFNTINCIPILHHQQNLKPMGNGVY